jgi:hypothetical protein
MVAVPSFVSANAKRGLELLEYAGDGLVPKTIREARQMVAGSVSPDKVMRMAAWLARHESDLASPKAQAYEAGDSERPTPGQVAWLLWGGDVGSANRDRARLWAERKRDQLIESGELNKGQGMDADKMYGYEMKDDDEGYDPLDSLLNAYSAAVKMGPKTDELLDKIMTVINAVRAMYVDETMHKGMKKNGGYSNPVECLTHAYLGLLNTARGDLRAMVMTLIHEAEMVVYGDKGESLAMPEGGEGMDDAEEPVMDGMSGMGMVRRAVQQVGGQFCVISETGRSFGCYVSEAEAADRLAQIERFSQDRAMPQTTEKLIEWHDDFHKLNEVSPAHKMVHDILEDDIELRGVARPYSLTQVDKVDLILKNTTAVVAKADEQRYTLGPWYVPGVEDAHGEFTDEKTLQLALWDWVRKGDRTVYLQHGERPAGEMVEILTLPFPVEADLVVPGEGTTMYKFPSNTPFMGVVWEPWAWDLVKAGKLRGYSIGGMAQRMEADLPDAALI